MKIQLSSQVKQRELELRPFIEEHAEKFGIDPNLVRALITQESKFIADARSPTGAFGYGQFTGIGARQVQNIANMADCPDPEGLHGFTKEDADDPDLGIKAICATLWWLFNKKYPYVSDKKIQLEAVLTFYNSGGKSAGLVVQHGGHKSALAAINSLPDRYRSQAVKYAPEVAMWYVAWHEHLESSPNTVPVEPPINPFENSDSKKKIQPFYRLVVEALNFLGNRDKTLEVVVAVRDGLTEVTLVLPGEFIPDEYN